MLRISSTALDDLIALALREYPLEACGLLAGLPAADGATPAGTAASAGGAGAEATRFYPCRNVAASARVYTIDPRDHLRAEMDAEDDDLEIVAVVHSHTHSEPYPSPTDVAAAPDPGWHYVIVGLKRSAPEVRSYRIVDGTIAEEPVVVVDTALPPR